MASDSEDIVEMATRCLNVATMPCNIDEIVAANDALARAVLDLAGRCDHLRKQRDQWRDSQEKWRTECGEGMRRSAEAIHGVIQERDAARLHEQDLEREVERLRGALRNVRMLAARALRKGFTRPDAAHLLRFCSDVGIEARILRDVSTALGEEGGVDEEE